MKKGYLKQSLLLTATVCASASVWAAGNGTDLKSETDRISYALGYQIGGDFRQQQVDLNNAAVMQGIADARSGAPAQMSEEAMHATLIELKRKVVAQQRAAGPEIAKNASTPSSAAEAAVAPLPHARRLAPQATEGAREFLEKNAKQKGVMTLSSGVQYRVLKDGTGKLPKESDKVALIYRGSLVNGKEFGNTDENGKPVAKTFALAALVPGMREAISHMNEGAKWQVFIPPQLGFDASTPLYRKVTIVDVELVAVNP
jgi:FKBP-type peptidyl-prolyl cis-trans isomerase FklB